MEELTPQQQAVAEVLCDVLGYGSFDTLGAAQAHVIDWSRKVASAVAPLSWLARGHRILSTCPGCGQAGLSTTAMTDLGYEYVVCECGTPEYPHLVEQLWHRDHMGLPGERIAWTTRRATLEEVAKDLRQQARKGEAGARGRTQLTYPGGWRAATRLVEALIRNMDDREQP